MIVAILAVALVIESALVVTLYLNIEGCNMQ